MARVFPPAAGPAWGPKSSGQRALALLLVSLFGVIPVACLAAADGIGAPPPSLALTALRNGRRGAAPPPSAGAAAAKSPAEAAASGHQAISLCGLQGPTELEEAKRLWEQARAEWKDSAAALEAGEDSVERTRKAAKVQRTEVRAARAAVEHLRDEVDALVSSEGQYDGRRAKSEAEIEEMREELKARREELDKQKVTLEAEGKKLDEKAEELKDKQWSMHGLDVWHMEEQEDKLKAEQRKHDRKVDRHEDAVADLKDQKKEIGKHQTEHDKGGSVGQVLGSHREEAADELRQRRALLEREEAELHQLETAVEHLTDVNKEAKSRLAASRKVLGSASMQLAEEQDELLAAMQGMQAALGLQGQALDSYEGALAATKEAMTRHCYEVQGQGTQDALQDVLDKLPQK